MTTKRIQTLAAIEELLDEVKVRNWSLATDAQIQGAMNEISNWQTRKLKIGSDFQEYIAMTTRWYPAQLDEPGSEYANLKEKVEEFNSGFIHAISDIKQEDTDRNLGTLEKAPTSLMKYPQFGGAETQDYFK